VWVAGFARQNLPLDPIGAVGCALLTTGQLATVGAATDGSGSSRLPLPVANDPSLAGTLFTSQWAVLDPSGPGGLAVTGGLEATIR
jgi:hypothetical protein